MTWLGKILVLVNLVFSFMAFTWAAALYLDRTDYTDVAPKDGNPPGELYLRKTRVKEQASAVRQALDNRRGDRVALAALEDGTGKRDGRPGDRDWYEAETAVVLHGTPRDVPPRPLRNVVYAKSELKLDEKNFGRPVMEDVKDFSGKPLRSVRASVEDSARAITAFVLAERKLEELTKLDTQAVEVITGDKEGKTKGLRRRLLEEQIKYADVIEEQKIIKPLLINAAVEAELILKRQDLLQRRVQSLKKETEQP